MLVALCPHCGFSREVRDQLKGREAACPRCRKTFQIGEEDSAEQSELSLAAEPEPIPAPKPTTPKSPPAPQSRAASKPAARPAASPPPLAKTPPPPPATPTQAVPVAPAPISSPFPPGPKGKIPNPIQPAGGFVELCPTLQTQEELTAYRAALVTPLQTPLEPRKMSVGYKFGLFLTAIFMILLPLVYVGMVLGLCYLEYLYFTTTFDEFSQNTGGSSGKPGTFAWILYFSIPVALGAVILVMIKPLIFGWGGKDTRFEITPEREPLLFDLIRHLCRFVGAPMPRRVFVNCDVNAYAGMTHGIWGAIFGGNACDLMIGLPLVAGMKTSELVGILAHEFGHFTQAGTRRMDTIVRRMLHWFSHIYYYRDSMDGWILAGARSGFHYFIFFFWIVLAVIWVARRFIWVLMMLGNFVAGFMSRQMEYDADSYEIRLAGSERFPQSSAKMTMLNIANSRTITDLNYMLQEDRLADNYPLLIAANMEIYRERLEKVAVKFIKEGKTGFFDSHPCDKDRIAAAAELAEPGVLHIDRPASLLFRNFLGLSREVSLHFYQNECEMTLEPRMLKNSGAVIDQLRRENLGNEAIVRFFQRSYVSGRMLPLPGVEPSRDARDMFFRLRQVRDRQAGYAVEALDAGKEFEKAETKYIQAVYCRELIRIGSKVDMSGLGFSFRSLGEANHTTDLLQAQLSAQKARIWSRDTLAAERLSVTRELLGQAEIQGRIEDGGELHRRMEEIYPLLVRIAEEQKELDEARFGMVAMEHWLGRFSSLTQDQAGSLWKTVEETSDLFRRLTVRLRMKYSEDAYPFEHGSQGVTLGNFLVPNWSETEMGPLDFFQAFATLFGRLMTTHDLLLGQAVAMALAVEETLELEPLPVPPPPEDTEENA